MKQPHTGSQGTVHSPQPTPCACTLTHIHANTCRPRCSPGLVLVLCGHPHLHYEGLEAQEARGILGKISCPLVSTEPWWEAGGGPPTGSSPDGPEMPPHAHVVPTRGAHKSPELPKPAREL